MSANPKRRSPARWLAPVALLVAVVVVATVVSGSFKGDGPDPAARRTTSAAGPTSTKPAVPKQRFYTVRSGDVLSVIAERFGVSVSQLEKLNPDVDAQTLRPGVRLRLRR